MNAREVGGRTDGRPPLVADGGDPTVYHVVCRDCTELEAVYDSSLRAGLDMLKHVLATRHRVTSREISAG